MPKKLIVVIGGPTASGKSAFALQLAELLTQHCRAVNNAYSAGCVIINGDSQQVYRELPVLTAQPMAEDTARIPHEMYGFLSVAQACSAGIWMENAAKAIDKAHHSGKLPIVVGGTGLYLRCLIKGVAAIPDIAQEIRKEARETLDEIGHGRFHILLENRDPLIVGKLNPTDTQRMLRAWEVLAATNQSIIEWQQRPHKLYYEEEQFFSFFLNPEREWLYGNCNQRFLGMLNKGALQEVEALAAMNLAPELPAMKALGVPELMAFNRGEISFEDAIKTAQMNTRRFAKRQGTWFRGQTHYMEEVDYNSMNDLSGNIMDKLASRIRLRADSGR